MAGTQSSERSDKGQPDSEEEKQQKADKRFSWKGLWRPGACWPIATGHLKMSSVFRMGPSAACAKMLFTKHWHGPGSIAQDTRVPGVHEGWVEPLTPNNKGY